MKKFNVSTVFTTVDKITKPVKKMTGGIKQFGSQVDKSGRKVSKFGAASPFKRMSFGVKNLGSNLGTLSKSISGVGGAMSGLLGLAVGGGLLSVGRDAIDLADKLGKMSGRMNVSVEDLSLYSFAAKQAGMSTGTFDKSMQKFNKRLTDAKEDTGIAKDSYAELGFTLQGLQGKTSGEVFKEVAKALGNVTDSSKRARLAQKFFGDEGVKMATMLENGYEGLQKTMEVGRENGAVITEKDAKDAAIFNDRMDELGVGIGGVFKTIAFDLLPTIKDMIVTTTEWVKENKEIVKWGVLITAGLGVMVGVLSVASMAAGGIAALGSAFGFVGLAIKGIALALTTNPIGLTITAIAIAAGLIYQHWEPISDFFIGMWDTVSSSFTSFYDMAIGGMSTLMDKISPVTDLIGGFFGGGDVDMKQTSTSNNIVGGTNINSKNTIDVNITDKRTTVESTTADSKQVKSVVNVGNNQIGALNGI